MVAMSPKIRESEVIDEEPENYGANIKGISKSLLPINLVKHED